MKTWVVPVFVIALAACADGPGKVISIDETGAVRGMAYIDRDGDGRLTALLDNPAQGVAALLVREGTSDTVARASTRADGTYELLNVPVGRYQLVAHRGTLGDSVQVFALDSSRVELASGDTAVRQIRIGFPTLTAVALRTHPAGRKVIAEGIALNAWATFGDSTIHIIDSTGALRAVRVQASPAQAGDSVRLVGTTGVSNGRAVIADATALILAAARGVPTAASLSTGAAATADAGRLVDGQARISGAIVVDTLTVGNFRRVGADDGTGRVEVMLNRSVAFTPESYQLGASINVTGVLAPAPSGSGWQLRPRTASEVTASFPTVTIAQARALPVGSRVYVHGIALNGWSTFGDSTVHVADATAAVRFIRVLPSQVAMGDSVRILGTTGLQDGRTALVDASVQIAALARNLPPLDSVSTAVAATASNGQRADHHVRIAGAVISDTATIQGDLILGLDDGSGRLEVVLDRNVTFNPGPYTPGGTFRGAGVLVPAPSPGTWRLKPRDRNDAAITFPTVTVAAARALPVGRRIVMEAIALNNWGAFGDSTVHVVDKTGSLRNLRVVGQVSSGDSIRLIGTVSRAAGQPVLTAVNASAILRGVGVPVPDSISTARAASADNGARDAAQVRISGTIVGSVTLPSNDQVFTVDDGSGRLEVLFDRDLLFNIGPTVPGALLIASGVLVPTGTGTWQLKPRAGADVVATYPTVTIAQARVLPAGKTVFVTGIALNGWATFGDGSVNIASAADVAIHVRNLSSVALFAGDSIRILGTTAVRNGQPVLNGVSASVMLAGATTPVPFQLSTKDAATAFNGARDATLAQINNATILEITTVGSDVVLKVDDGTGEVKVVLDGDVGFATGVYKTTDKLRVRGILLPNSDGTAWEIKPRSPSDVTILP